MAEKEQVQKDMTRAEVNAAGLTDGEHDAELDALLNSKNGVANNLSVPLFCREYGVLKV
jgi:hypothetical protein